MLKLNGVDVARYGDDETDLNTSHVKVKHTHKQCHHYKMYHLNTSHVKVKLASSSFVGDCVAI